jgi:hypothetical protein
MRRRTRIAIATVALAASTMALAGCGGRTDGGNPGNPAGDTTTTIAGQTTLPGS